VGEELSIGVGDPALGRGCSGFDVRVVFDGRRVSVESVDEWRGFDRVASLVYRDLCGSGLGRGRTRIGFRYVHFYSLGHRLVPVSASHVISPADLVLSPCGVLRPEELRKLLIGTQIEILDGFFTPVLKARKLFYFFSDMWIRETAPSDEAFRKYRLFILGKIQYLGDDKYEMSVQICRRIKLILGLLRRRIVDNLVFVVYRGDFLPNIVDVILYDKGITITCIEKASMCDPPVLTLKISPIEGREHLIELSNRVATVLASVSLSLTRLRTLLSIKSFANLVTRLILSDSMSARIGGENRRGVEVVICLVDRVSRAVECWSRVVHIDARVSKLVQFLNLIHRINSNI